MSIFNRRNAIIGYFALQAMKRARRNAAVGYLAAQGVEHTRAHRRGRRVLRIGMYVLLGIVSAGVLAGLAFFWRQRSAGLPGSSEEFGDDAEPVADAAGDALDSAHEGFAEVATEVAAQAESDAANFTESVESAPAT